MLCHKATAIDDLIKRPAFWSLGLFASVYIDSVAQVYIPESLRLGTLLYLLEALICSACKSGEQGRETWFLFCRMPCSPLLPARTLRGGNLDSNSAALEESENVT